MGGKACTSIESPILNRCDTIWNIYVSEEFATVKSTHSNCCDTIWNVYVCEVAIPKSRISNRCDTIWDIYVSEGFTFCVFVNRFISIICTLNGRKVTT